jgi:hypothetical protein
VDRNTVLWTITIFFGASILFAALRRATEGEGTGVTLGVQALALGLLIAGIVVVVRRLR